MSESPTLQLDWFEREIAAFNARSGTARKPSIRDLIEKTRDKSFRDALTNFVRPLKDASPSGRYPTVAQVRKMLAANDNYLDGDSDYSAISAEYKTLFDRCLSERGDVNGLLQKIAKDPRVSLSALAAITAKITGRSPQRVTRKTAKSAILDRFADLAVSSVAKHTAGTAKPF